MDVQSPDTSVYPAALSLRSSVQLSRFSKRVAARVAGSYPERDAIFKLRYQSYLRAGLVSQNSFLRYIEPADHATNASLMGLYVDRRLISSLRLQISNASSPHFSSLELFPHVLEPLLRSDKTIVDMSRVVTEGESARPYVWMPYLILRSWIVAAEHFRADYISAAMRPQHLLFYSRLLGSELHSEIRRPPDDPTTLGLVTVSFASSAKRLYENLPFLRSTPLERQQLFEHGTTPIKATALQSRRTRDTPKE
jgi:hypothetical protein